MPTIKRKKKFRLFFDLNIRSLWGQRDESSLDGCGWREFGHNVCLFPASEADKLIISLPGVTPCCVTSCQTVWYIFTQPTQCNSSQETSVSTSEGSVGQKYSKALSWRSLHIKMGGVIAKPPSGLFWSLRVNFIVTAPPWAPFWNWKILFFGFVTNVWWITAVSPAWQEANQWLDTKL